MFLMHDLIGASEGAKAIRIQKATAARRGKKPLGAITKRPS
jgi:hypothetical protein